MKRESDVNALVNLLMSYFGDQRDADAIPQVRKAMRGYPAVRRAFKDGLDQVLADPDFDYAHFVGFCANRRANTAEEGRAWLLRLKKSLAGAVRAKKAPQRRTKRRS